MNDAIVQRRRFLGLLGAAAATVLSACRGDSLPGESFADAVTTTTRLPATSVPVPSSTTSTTRPPRPIPPPVPGRPEVIKEGPPGTHLVALTIDDGTSAECIARYAEFAQRTGTAITFSPNGVNAGWEAAAPILHPLVEAGQVQIANHTWSHPDLVRASEARIRDEIERNEDWIEKTFACTSRPWFRPPYGSRNARTDELAAELGYTRIVLWNGSFGDSELLRPDEVLALAERYMSAGTIMLGHANYLTITQLFDRVQLLMAQRGLQPVTLEQMFAVQP